MIEFKLISIKVIDTCQFLFVQIKIHWIFEYETNLHTKVVHVYLTQTHQIVCFLENIDFLFIRQAFVLVVQPFIL